MMKNVIRTFGVFALALAAVSASAQPSTQVSVPFAFAAAGQVFPAGDYRLSLNESNNVVTLTGQDLKTIFLLTVPGDHVQGDRRVLRFLHDGDDWSLQGIAFDGTVRRFHLAKMKRD
jgi:hypothetical protein